MNAVISNEEIERRLKNYLVTHKTELDEMITKKIGTSVRSAITDAFSSGDSYRNAEPGWARQFIYDEVNDQVQVQMNRKGIKIDTDDVQRKVNQAVQRKLKRLNVDIKF